MAYLLANLMITYQHFYGRAKYDRENAVTIRMHFKVLEMEMEMASRRKGTLRATSCVGPELERVDCWQCVGSLLSSSAPCQCIFTLYSQPNLKASSLICLGERKLAILEVLPLLLPCADKERRPLNSSLLQRSPDRFLHC